jgi:ribonuclease HI/endonuclease/exonuclease/phosphatase family metal-dependent hydrolase
MTDTPQETTLRILQYNVHKGRNNMAEVLRHPRIREFDVLCFQEPFRNTFGAAMQTHNPIKDQFREYIPNDVEAHVAVFINTAIPLGDIEITDYGPNLTAVTLKNQGRNGKHKITIYNAYNPCTDIHLRDTITGLPTNSPLAQLNAALQARRRHSNIVLGDFNLRNERWGGPGHGAIEAQCPRAARYLVELLERHSLELCFEPGLVTHPGIPGQFQDSTIDMIFASDDIREALIKSEIPEDLNIGSDHEPIETVFRTYHYEGAAAAYEERYLLKRMDVEVFKATLKLTLPEVPEQGLTVSQIDAIAHDIQKALQTALAKSTPKARMNPRSRPGWTPECTDAIWECKRARRRYREDPTEETRIDFQHARRHKKKTINTTLRDDHRNRISGIKDMKDAWRIAKWAKSRDIPRTRFTPNIRDSTGTIQETTAGKAEALKSSFFPLPPPPDNSDIEAATYGPPLSAPKIREEETLAAIKGPAPDKAPGPDQIPNRVLQLAADMIATPLTNLFNNCLEEGHYPRPFKNSTTVALRKPGKSDYAAPKSYRPIALLNTLGKAFESIMARRIAYLAEHHGLLPKMHTGGRTALGCEHAVHTLLEEIHRAGIHRKVASLLLMDVSGAFDNVAHPRLIHNLRTKRIPIEWTAVIQSFLTDRSTRIRLPEGESEPFETPNGIPQGSPLSPILYLFYNTPLLEIQTGCDATTLGYIDDIGILVTGPNTEVTNRHLNRIHAEMERWAIRASSVFAPGKYQLLHFMPPERPALRAGRRQEDLKLQLASGAEQTVKPADSARYLGVYLDTELTGAAHLEHVKKAATQQLQAISQLGHSTWGVTLQQLRHIYQGTVKPRILYAASCWYLPQPGDKSNLQRQQKRTLKSLEAIQKRALRHISGNFRTASLAAMEVELHVQPIHIALRRACEASLLRIASSAHHEEILRIRNTPNYDRRVQPLRKTHHRSPLHKLEGAYRERFPDAPERELIRAGLFPPWERPPKIKIPSRKMGQIAHDCALEAARKDDNHWVTYTDGSEIEEEVGAAAYNSTKGIRSTRWLGNNTVSNVYAGELVGIIMALDQALKAREGQIAWDKPKALTIFSDSQAGLKAIGNPRNKSGQALVHQIRLRLNIARRCEIEVTLQWVPAHCGIPGNEEADVMAKHATGWRESGRAEPALLIERNTQLISAAKRRENDIAKKAWQQAWSTGKTGKTLREILPIIHKRSLKLHDGLSKAESSVVSQARMGKIALRDYLSKIGRADTNLCSCGESQTVKHILLSCPNHEELRQKVWMSRNSRHSCAKTMLMTQSEAGRIAKFLIHTGLLGQFEKVRQQIEW